MAFGLNKNDKDMNIMVVDSGGSTVDFSVISTSGDAGDDGKILEVLSTSGDTHLGGDDLDNELIKWLVDDFKNENDNFDLSKDSMAMQRLKEAAEKAKCELSSATTTEINLPYITAVDGVPKHLVRTLTRAKFEQICHDVIQRHLPPMQKALEQSGLSKSDIDEVILVGGTTRVPAIQELVRNFFGKEPNRKTDPDIAVAAGAAI
jgi:molecular chaperone DnaK